MEKLKRIITRHSRGKKVLWLFILTNLVYAVMLLITIPKTMSYSQGLKILDMLPMGYTPEYINSLFGTLEENGRDVYLYTQIPVDMIYPFLFGISYCLMMGYFLKKIRKLNSGYYYLCFLPLIAGIADYLENIGIIIMLKNYPNLSPGSMYATNIFSIVKSMTTTVFFIALIITLLMLGIKAIKARGKSANANMKLD